MLNAEAQPRDRSALVYRYHERLYRLALLVSGEPQAAAALVERAYRQLPLAVPAEAAEAMLARALLPRRMRRKRWAYQPTDLSHTGLDRASADALLGVLAALPPAARLVVGLAYIGGHGPAEIDTLLGTADAPAAMGTLAGLRSRAAQALGLLPADTSPALLARLDRWLAGQMDDDEQLALRRDLLADPELRAARDALLEVRELLPRAVPALFVAAPPPALVARLLGLVQRRPMLAGSLSARRAQLGLVAAVLLLATAIIAVPSWLASRASAPLAARPNVPASAAALLDAALHRFAQPPLTQGVLHEVYRVEPPGQAALQIERWYDYASPNRLATTVTEVGNDNAPLLQISSDGRSQVQFRYGQARAFGQESADVQLAQADAQALIPLLRGEPQAAGIGRAPGEPGDVGPLYLAQARDAGATLLGQTTLLGRPAALLTYRAARLPWQGRAATPARVILTIDAQTYTLLDITALPDGEAESAAQHPLRAALLEVLDAAPDTAPFTLPSGPEISRQLGLGSVRFPFVRANTQLTLDAAAQRVPDQLLAPLQLPDAAMRGVVFENGGGEQSDIVLLYEGEFQDVLLLQNFHPRGSQQLGDEQTAGEFRYRLLNSRGFGASLVAMVYRPETPDITLGVILNDVLSPAAQRQSRLEALIRSLTPVNNTSLPQLRQHFRAPDYTAGHSQ